MPTSDFAELRRQLAAVQGPVCLIPSCSEPWTDTAHIEGSGMGGRASTYRIENLVGLCKHHHDVFDGRQLSGRQELFRELMAHLVKTTRSFGVAVITTGT